MTDFKKRTSCLVKKNPSFQCKYPDDYSVPYIDVMAALYADARIPEGNGRSNVYQ